MYLAVNPASRSQPKLGDHCPSIYGPFRWETLQPFGCFRYSAGLLMHQRLLPVPNQLRPRTLRFAGVSVYLFKSFSLYQGNSNTVANQEQNED